MTKEVPFKSIRITLSEEAIQMLGSLRYNGAFRSDSMTVEECIRAIYDITLDIEVSLELGKDIEKRLSSEKQAIILQRLAIRLKRFFRHLPITKRKS